MSFQKTLALTLAVMMTFVSCTMPGRTYHPPTSTRQTAHGYIWATNLATPSSLASSQPGLSPNPMVTQTAQPTFSLPVQIPTLEFTATPTQPISERRILGESTQGWPIEVYQFGSGPVRVAFIGGIHGGYEWNTILLAYHAIDHFMMSTEDLPSQISLYIIPSANPDGLALVTGQVGRFSAKDIKGNTSPGRLNGNQVDLNRNWDCNWHPIGMWGKQKVSGGESPFSEVETQTLSKFLTDPPMTAVVFWHSAFRGVYPGSCGEPFKQANELATVYAKASGYPYKSSFTSYAVTGDATDWLSTQGIPAFSVELHNHQDIDWKQNLKGMLALFEFLSH